VLRICVVALGDGKRTGRGKGNESGKGGGWCERVDGSNDCVRLAREISRRELCRCRIPLFLHASIAYLASNSLYFRSSNLIERLCILFSALQRAYIPRLKRHSNSASNYSHCSYHSPHSKTAWDYPPSPRQPPAAESS